MNVKAIIVLNDNLDNQENLNKIDSRLFITKPNMMELLKYN
jgi:hypothetical protein